MTAPATYDLKFETSQPSWFDLMTEAAEVRGGTPCTPKPGAGDPWFSEDPAERHAAAVTCETTCQAFLTCRAYAAGVPAADRAVVLGSGVIGGLEVARKGQLRRPPRPVIGHSDAPGQPGTPAGDSVAPASHKAGSLGVLEPAVAGAVTDMQACVGDDYCLEDTCARCDAATAA